VGVVGLGRWGLRLAGAIDRLRAAELRWLSDVHIDRQLRLAIRYPTVRVASDVDDLLDDGFLDAVVIATPPPTRYDLACRALLAGKHVLIRDPVASTGQEADELVRLAQQRGCRLMVGEPLLFHPAVRKLKELTEVERLGQIHYVYGSRRDLGDSADGAKLVRSADVALVLYVLGEDPLQVWARGDSHRESGAADVVHCRLVFPRGLSAYLQLCRLDARRNRKVAVVGSRATAVLEQRGCEHELTIYDIDGDVVTPRVSAEDPFRLASDHFVSMIRSSGSTAVGPRDGAAVVHALEALRRSLAENGKPQDLHAGAEVQRLPTQRFA
jgi:predicted dehydrogenase